MPVSPALAAGVDGASEASTAPQISNKPALARVIILVTAIVARAGFVSQVVYFGSTDGYLDALD
jgi:hypothetical protein